MRTLAMAAALWLCAWRLMAQTSDVGPDARLRRGPVLEGQTARPLRYWPIAGDFVITNGSEYFNRPLYCLNSAFRIDGGDKPEFSLYLPGRGGNLRFGVQTLAGSKWLDDARHIIARYRPGSLLYTIDDPLLRDGELELSVLPLASIKGCIVKLNWNGASPLPLFCAYGGLSETKGARNGDIGCEREPVAQFFQLRAEQCRANAFATASNTFVLNHNRTRIFGVLPPAATLATADAGNWSNPAKFFASTNGRVNLPVMTVRFELQPRVPAYLSLQPLAEEGAGLADDLPKLFTEAEAHRREIAEHIVVDTPDPFINAAAAALCVAGDAVWDARQQCFMHGAVAWRSRLLGWRGPYTGDALGWHERTAAHFAGFAAQQNTAPIPPGLPPADESSHLARSEDALHSNGDLTKAHYDMNLVAVDAFFRHLLWTGDLDYARKFWPVIERHLAWERRLFRREFGPDRLPLYEGYCCIWASDNLQYDGGGATHATAYNYWHNRMAARVARLLGENPQSYDQEADSIAAGMRQNLWLADRGWYAECKDYLGLQLPHPSAGLWTFYHAVDSDAADPFQAWQMTRFVDTQIAHIPIHGPNVPDEQLFTLPESNWLPYMWSVNNVVMAEVAHTSLGYWEANRPDAAFRTFKGCLLDSMYLGLCPGNLGCMTGFDVARGEAQRDFGDACGATSRALVEGLFGLHPDGLNREWLIKPGWPAAWDHAAIQHPDIVLNYERSGSTEKFTVKQKTAQPWHLRLQLASRRSAVADVAIDGQPALWTFVHDAVGAPRLLISGPALPKCEVVVKWSGEALADNPSIAVNQGSPVDVPFREAKLAAVYDPQHALSQITTNESALHAVATGTPGQRTIFASVHQGNFYWWQPISLEIRDPTPQPAAFDWRQAVAPQTKFDLINLTANFNDQVGQIFRNQYRSPRSPFCSLAIPWQGIGGWCDPSAAFTVDDSGLRAAAAEHGGIFRLPDGIPFSTPGNLAARNVIYTSQWSNYPQQASVPLAGRASHAFLLLAGSSNPMQSQFDNGEIIVTYADGSTNRLALRNPDNWWPIDQDYFLDDYAFKRPGPIPPRVDLRTGKVRLLEPASFKGKGGKVPGGAATVLELPLDPAKELKSLTLHTLANDVVVGLMAVTLER